MPFDNPRLPDDKILRNLTDARARIADPNNWCVNTLMRTGPQGNDQFCAMGALNMAAHGHWGYGALPRATSYLARHSTIDDVARFYDPATSTPAEVESLRVVACNNYFGHAAVMRMFDAAIAERTEELMKEVAHAA